MFSTSPASSPPSTTRPQLILPIVTSGREKSDQHAAPTVWVNPTPVKQLCALRHNQAVATRCWYQGCPPGDGGDGRHVRRLVESHAECDEPRARKPLVGLPQRAPGAELQRYAWADEQL